MKRGVVRLGISLDPELRDSLDRWVKSRNAASRSDAVRFLVRQELAAKALEDPGAETVGTVTLLFRHDDANVLRRLTAAEHRWGEHVHSSTHVHLPGGGCVEALIVSGTRREVEGVAEDLRGVKGVLLARFEAIALPKPTGPPEPPHTH